MARQVVVELKHQMLEAYGKSNHSPHAMHEHRLKISRHKYFVLALHFWSHIMAQGQSQHSFHVDSVLRINRWCRRWYIFANLTDLCRSKCLFSTLNGPVEMVCAKFWNVWEKRKANISVYLMKLLTVFDFCCFFSLSDTKQWDESWGTIQYKHSLLT